MQNAGGLHFGQGGTPSQEPPYETLPMQNCAPNSTTSSLRQFRKKDNVEKVSATSTTGSTSDPSHVARVAPHAHYPTQHKQNDFYRYPQYQDYNSVKYSEIAEVPQQMHHLDGHVQQVLPKHKDMCNLQQMQQGYVPPEMHQQYKEQQMAYKPDQHYPQFPQMKYALPTQHRKYPHPDNTYMPIQHHPRMRPMIPDIPTDYTLDQSRIYAQNQRFFPANTNYNYVRTQQQYPDYRSCNYNRTQMPRYMERSVSPTHRYDVNYLPAQKLSYSNYPGPAYAQHYQQHRRAVHQNYYHHQQAPAQVRAPQYPVHHHQMAQEEGHVTASNTIRQYIENWAEEEPTTEIRDETNEVFVINASEIPQYLESGVPLVASEDGQYVFKSNVSIDNTGAIKILDKGPEGSDNQERVVSLHIVESGKTDCLLNARPIQETGHNACVHQGYNAPYVASRVNLIPHPYEPEKPEKPEAPYQSCIVAPSAQRLHFDETLLETTIKENEKESVLNENEANAELDKIVEDTLTSSNIDIPIETACDTTNPEPKCEYYEKINSLVDEVMDLRKNTKDDHPDSSVCGEVSDDKDETKATLHMPLIDENEEKVTELNEDKEEIPPETETPPLQENQTVEYPPRPNTVPKGKTTEDRKEGPRKKRLFSVDDIINRIGQDPKFRRYSSPKISLENEDSDKESVQENEEKVRIVSCHIIVPPKSEEPNEDKTKQMEQTEENIDASPEKSEPSLEQVESIEYKSKPTVSLTESTDLLDQKSERIGSKEEIIVVSKKLEDEAIKTATDILPLPKVSEDVQNKSKEIELSEDHVDTTPKEVKTTDEKEELMSEITKDKTKIEDKVKITNEEVCTEVKDPQGMEEKHCTKEKNEDKAPSLEVIEDKAKITDEICTDVEDEIKDPQEHCTEDKKEDKAPLPEVIKEKAKITDKVYTEVEDVIKDPQVHCTEGKKEDKAPSPKVIEDKVKINDEICTEFDDVIKDPQVHCTEDKKKDKAPSPEVIEDKAKTDKVCTEVEDVIKDPQVHCTENKKEDKAPSPEVIEDKVKITDEICTEVDDVIKDPQEHCTEDNKEDKVALLEITKDEAKTTSELKTQMCRTKRRSLSQKSTDMLEDLQNEMDQLDFDEEINFEDPVVDKETKEVEELLSNENVEYRNVIKIEENSIILHIAGELVEITVNQADGHKVIKVFAMSPSTVVDFNDNYESVDRSLTVDNPEDFLSFEIEKEEIVGETTVSEELIVEQVHEVDQPKIFTKAAKKSYEATQRKIGKKDRSRRTEPDEESRPAKRRKMRKEKIRIKVNGYEPTKVEKENKVKKKKAKSIEETKNTEAKVKESVMSSNVIEKTEVPVTEEKKDPVKIKDTSESQKKKLSIQEYNNRKRKSEKIENEDKLPKVAKIETNDNSKKQERSIYSDVTDNSINSKDPRRRLSSSEKEPTKSKRKVSFDEHVKICEENNVCEVSSTSVEQQYDNNWEDLSNSPKNSMTDGLDSFIDNKPKPNLKSSKCIIDINDFDTTLINNELDPSSTSKNTENLRKYKAEVDSKLNSLDLKIPRKSNYEDVLIQRFLNKERLSLDEIRRIKQIIYLKKKMQQMSNRKKSEPEKYVVGETGELKLQLKKVGRDKKKKRFRNLYAESSSDTSDNEPSKAEFSVCDRTDPLKLVFKRKEPMVALQPVVRLQREAFIESMAELLKK